MARKKSRRRTRKFTGINVLNLAEAYSYTNLLTQTAFNLDPLTFIMGDPSLQSGSTKGFASGRNRISLTELIKRGGTVHSGSTLTEFELVAQNVRDAGPKPIVTALVMGVFWTVGKKALSKPRSRVNKMLKDVGVGNFIRV